MPFYLFYFIFKSSALFGLLISVVRLRFSMLTFTVCSQVAEWKWRTWEGGGRCGHSETTWRWVRSVTGCGARWSYCLPATLCWFRRRMPCSWPGIPAVNIIITLFINSPHRDPIAYDIDYFLSQYSHQIKTYVGETAGHSYLILKNTISLFSKKAGIEFLLPSVGSYILCSKTNFKFFYKCRQN